MKSVADNITLTFHDFLAVIIPGLTGLFFLFQINEFKIEFGRLFEMNSENTWKEGIIYFSAAYFIGYVIYVLGSLLDGWYDRIKRRGLELDKNDSRDNEDKITFIKEIPKKRKIVNFIFRNLIDTHNLIVKVVEFKNRDIGNEFDGPKHQIINAYQYSYRRLMIEAPAMFLEAERYFANARFFRSMSIILVIGSIIWLTYYGNIISAAWIFFAAVVSLFTFFNRWRKANHVVLKSIIIIEGTKANKN